MTNSDYEFTFDMAGIDRQALLEAAAAEIDALRGTLGEGGKPAETPEGRETRGCQNDQAFLPKANPDVYKITDKDFLARNLKAPVRFTELSKKFDFYWIRIPVGLTPARNWAFNKIEMRIEFNKGEPSEALPKAYQILPNMQFQTLLKASDYLEVRLDENFQFAVSTGTLEGQLGTGSGKVAVGTETIAKGGLGLVVGPFVYHIKRAKIHHNSTGMEWVKWTLDGAEFFQEDQPDLIVIAQVPKSTKVVKIDAALQAYRYFNYGSAGWRAAVRHLRAEIKSFFEEGMPLRDDKDWAIETDGS